MIRPLFSATRPPTPLLVADLQANQDYPPFPVSPGFTEFPSYPGRHPLQIKGNTTANPALSRALHDTTPNGLLAKARSLYSPDSLGEEADPIEGCIVKECPCEINTTGKTWRYDGTTRKIGRIIQWLLKVVQEPLREKVASTPIENNKDCSAESEVVPLNILRNNQCQKKKVDSTIISSCKNFDFYTESSFFSTLNLKRIHTMKINKESIARGLGVSFNKGADSPAANVRNAKVLPLSDSAIALSTGQHCKKYDKRAPKAKADKTKALSKMKELLRWVAAAKLEMRGKCINPKVLHFRNKAPLKALPVDELSNESPKISFRWDVENCSNMSSSVCSALSVSSSAMNAEQTTKPGSWITTDSEFVVLEL